MTDANNSLDNADQELSANSNSYMVIVVYALYLAGVFFLPSIIIGVTLAYALRGNNLDWIESHYRFQIFGFWIYVFFIAVILGLTYGAIQQYELYVLGSYFANAEGVILLIISSIASSLGAFLWWLVRNARGLAYFTRRHRVPDPSKMLGGVESINGD